MVFYESGLAYLRSFLGMVNAGWLCSMGSEIFLQMKFIIFEGCPIKTLFYLRSLLHIMSSLFSQYIAHDITLNISEFILNSVEKVKPGLKFSSMCMFSESNGSKT